MVLCQTYEHADRLADVPLEVRPAAVIKHHVGLVLLDGRVERKTKGLEPKAVHGADIDHRRRLFAELLGHFLVETAVANHKIRIAIDEPPHPFAARGRLPCACSRFEHEIVGPVLKLGPERFLLIGSDERGTRWPLALFANDHFPSH